MLHKPCLLLQTLLLVCCLLPLAGLQILTAQPATAVSRPRLVVGIVVDQMRTDYVYRYWNKLGKNGLKKLVNKGFVCANTQFNYVPTYTAPGHASVYTGATPSVHGIIGNAWFSRSLQKNLYCTADTLVRAVGGSETAGQMSPRNLLATTITDELKLFTNHQSKVIGIALKDRGAILPAGHLANAAYWFDGASGNFMTSTYYMNKLPQWVIDFNNQKQPEKYLRQNWETLLPIAAYTESLPDDNPYETPYAGQTAPVFPHPLPQIAQTLGSGYDLLRATPFGNTFTKDFAIAAIQAEKLGKTPGITDFIAISFSSTDYIGHQFGPRSVEIEDTYLRFDKDIEDLLRFLDHYLGTNNVLLFLTADHAVADVPAHLQSINLPAQVFERAEPVKQLKSWFYNKYADSLLLTFINSQIYLNRNRTDQLNLPLQQIQDEAATFMLGVTGVANAITATALQQNSFTDWRRQCTQNGFCPTRSGDVAISLLPGWMEHEYTGTTHGSVYRYDTQVPLYWFGWKIPKGKQTTEPVFIPDIAATLAARLQIPYPNACTGTPVEGLTRNW
ncbi:alkaline phosphatase family protein [Sphingobacteriales bacterium UPWRP_1]|nr:hypothetical protein BVG80_08985 [Sphingobacteriales bacterium TSM_CSM]PSJ76174.1 alkaline phosphatase family protein [Sphingobacteriales bacterium UPWRP_1]